MEVGGARSKDCWGLASGEDRGVTSVTVSSEAVSEVLGLCFRLADPGLGCCRGDEVDGELESLTWGVGLLSPLLDEDE